MSYLIAVEQLYPQLQAGDWLIVDTRFALGDLAYGEKAYAQSHLPGAVYLDLNRDLSGPLAEHGGRHPWPELPVLLATLRGVGLSNQSRVLIYDDAANMYAGRLWALLRWLGHEQIFLLDGGWQAWVGAGMPVTADLPEIQPGDFEPELQPQFLASVEELRAPAPDVVVLDARSAERYRGESEPLDARAGHIPGALNRPFAENLAGQLFKSPEDLRTEMLALGLRPEQEIIVYCGSGVTANHTLVALAEAGFQRGRLYPGSWSDWVSYPDNPIATGPQP
ncbi:MAG: sulfurtransferase [Candidatus Sericytochromatia bacterium]